MLQVCQFFLKLLCGKPFLTRAIVKKTRNTAHFGKKAQLFSVIPNFIQDVDYNFFLPKREKTEKKVKISSDFQSTEYVFPHNFKGLEEYWTHDTFRDFYAS